MVARRAHNPKVVGSNPASATTHSQPFGLAFLYIKTCELAPTGLFLYYASIQ